MTSKRELREANEQISTELRELYEKINHEKSNASWEAEKALRAAQTVAVTCSGGATRVYEGAHTDTYDGLLYVLRDGRHIAQYPLGQWIRFEIYSD